MSRGGGLRWLAALAIGMVATVAVVRGQRSQGLVRDEVVYMNAGSRYVRWWIDLVDGKEGMTERPGIASHFGGPRSTDNNREHPPLMKTLFGLSKLVVHDELGWASRITAYRLPTALCFGLLCALVVLFAAAVFGLAEAVLAGVLTACLPRTFFHAGLATFDVPMMTFWFATLYAHHRALASGGWRVGLGLVFGLALATKHNALLLPLALGAHHAFVSWQLTARSAEPGGGAGAGLGARLQRVVPTLWRRQLWGLVALVTLGPLFLIAVWPWLWFEPFAHIREWIGFHLDHVHYNFEYLGRNWNAPPFPWHVPLVTILTTIPVATLLATAVGAVTLIGRARAGHAADPDRAPTALLVLSAVVAVGPFVFGRSPIFGAEKHFAAAFPTLTIFAGVGIVAAARRATVALWGPAARPWLGRAAIAILGGLVGLAALTETAMAQPYALSHYNALAGGPAGGADRGMNRQFWGYAARGALPWLNDRLLTYGTAPPHPVYSHDASPAWPVYREEGLLHPELPDAGHERAGIAASHFALVIHELHFNRHDYLIWQAYGTTRPAYVLTFRGVPLVSVYERPPLP
jgi:4-amino-4-deoxy-L-arabinose transferase-like glycosyltransferase